MRAVAMLVAGVALNALALTTSSAATTSPRPAFVPTWSPDGKQIAFVVTMHDFSPSARYRIVRTSSRPGGKVHTVLAARGACCAQMEWAADGQILINPASRVKSVRAQGGNPKPKRLFFPACDNSYGCQTAGFILSPDGEYAAASNTSDAFDPNYPYGIGLVKLRRGAQPEVLPSPLAAEEAGSAIVDVPLTFSPDSKKLIFRRASWNGPGNDGPSALRAIGLAGGGSVPLAQSGIPGGSSVPADATQVQWSPDDSWVAYAESDPTGNQRLEVEPTAGDGTSRVLATCDADSLFGFSWSPTSQLIAYACEAEARDSGRFVTVKPDGTDATNLLEDRNLVYDQAYSAGGPRWSPDGSRLLFLAWGLQNNVDQVFTVRADGSHLTRRS